MATLIKLPGGRTLCLGDNQNALVYHLKEQISQLEGIPVKDQTLVHNCKILANEETISCCPFVVIDLQFKLLGGKGGFGALLRY